MRLPRYKWRQIEGTETMARPMHTAFAADFFAPAPVISPDMRAAMERENALRCAQEDVDTARREYVRRRAHIGKVNKATGMFAKADKSTAFKMFNKARAALNRAEKAQKALINA